MTDEIKTFFDMVKTDNSGVKIMMSEICTMLNNIREAVMQNHSGVYDFFNVMFNYYCIAYNIDYNKLNMTLTSNRLGYIKDKHIIFTAPNDVVITTLYNHEFINPIIRMLEETMNTLVESYSPRLDESYIQIINLGKYRGIGIIKKTINYSYYLIYNDENEITIDYACTIREHTKFIEPVAESMIKELYNELISKQHILTRVLNDVRSATLINKN